MRIVKENDLEYYTIDRLHDIQGQMLKLLDLIDQICRKNNLHYFLDGGSAIGAYRHGGFIPWDDDLDMCLPKPDYLKLINILKSLDSTKYFLFDYNLDLHYASYFGERINIFGSADGKKRHIYPIKIDIIPINLVEDSYESINENRIFRELSNFIFYGYCDSDYQNTALDIFQSRFSGNKKNFMSFYNNEYGLRTDYENSLFARPAMAFSTKNLYRYIDLFPLKEINFSNLKSFLPNTDLMLKDIYGDYMSFPEIDKRKPEAATVYESTKTEPLYNYLLDRSKKTKIQMLRFTMLSNCLCK